MRRQLCLCAVLVFISAPLHADSVVGKFSANGAQLKADVRAGYKGPGVLPADSSQDTHFLTALPILGPSASVSTNHTHLPAFSTVAKDKAEGLTTVDFTFGTPYGPAANDTVHFHLQAIASAVDAHNTAGNPANAQVTDTGHLHFFIDPFGVAPGTHVGDMLLDAIAPLGPFEFSRNVDVLQDSITIASFGPGSPGGSVPLFASHSYEIIANYMTEVPFGADPMSFFDFTSHLLFADSILPEPTSLAIFVSFGLLVSTRRRRVSAD